MFFRVVRRLPACAIVCGAALFSVSSLADTDVFTALDNPATAKKNFDGNVQAGYSAQTGNSSSNNLNANTTMTWFQPNGAQRLTPLLQAFVLQKNIRRGGVHVTTFLM
jgi:putative salt-induced outer membrane protein